ncbi:hypothetical protein J6590_065478 [Homalodisca vitripennis]|nr:hypothetical protein J6590_065478 [Homalodisca vitripennis]
MVAITRVISIRQRHATSTAATLPPDNVVLTVLMWCGGAWSRYGQLDSMGLLWMDHVNKNSHTSAPTRSENRTVTFGR